MKIFSTDSAAFKGKLHIDPLSKYTRSTALKDFGKYIEEQTSKDLHVYVRDMPKDHGFPVNVYDWWDHFDEEAYEKKFRYSENRPERHYWGAERYGGMLKENINIIYRSPRVVTESGFYLDSREEYEVSRIYTDYLKENLKLNAGLDIKG